MKKYLAKFLTAASVLAMAATGASADGMYGAQSFKDAAPEYVWSGFYLGVHAGGASSEVEDSIGFFQKFGGDEEDSALFGIQTGYNWQRGNFVFGVEGDISATDLTQSAEVIGGLVSANAETSWFTTLRLRAGFAHERFLIYATGGLAGTQIDVDASALIFNSSDSETLFGYAYGGGVEAMVTPRVSIKLEYLHLDFDEEELSLFGGFVKPDVELDADVIRAGINIKLN